MLLFMALWHLAVYCPLAHAMWHPQGFMYKHGVIDFGVCERGGGEVYVCGRERCMCVYMCE